MADRIILGEKYDDYAGFECDNCDPYDPFEEYYEEVYRETVDAALCAKIREGFGEDADEIIREVAFGRSVDAAIQSLFM